MSTKNNTINFKILLAYIYAFLFMVYFLPIEWMVNTSGSGIIQNALRVQSRSIQFHFSFKIIAYISLIVFTLCVFKKHKNRLPLVISFLCYTSVISLSFLVAYFKGHFIFRDFEETMFLLIFLPSSYFALFMTESTLLKVFQVFTLSVILFFIYWLFSDHFFVEDYLSFHTAVHISLLFLFFRTKKNMRKFLILFILGIYLYYFYVTAQVRGLGQILSFFAVVFFILLCQKRFVIAIVFLGLILVFINIPKIKTVYECKIKSRETLLKGITFNKIFGLEITRYRRPYNAGREFKYPHNSIVEAFYCYHLWGGLWYLIVNVFALVGFRYLKNKEFLWILFIYLSILSLKQGSLLTQKLLIMFHVFGLNLFLTENIKKLIQHERNHEGYP